MALPLRLRLQHRPTAQESMLVNHGRGLSLPPLSMLSMSLKGPLSTGSPGCSEDYPPVVHGRRRRSYGLDRLRLK